MGGRCSRPIRRSIKYKGGRTIHAPKRKGGKPRPRRQYCGDCRRQRFPVANRKRLTPLAVVICYPFL